MTTTTLPALRDGLWTVDPAGTTATFTARELGFIRVAGGLTVTGGTATVVGGRPVAAAATLDAGSVRSGSARRDRDLAGPRFFRAAEHPEIEVRTTAVTPDEDGWSAAALLTVAGGGAPLDLRATVTGREPGRLHLTIAGVLDLGGTPVRPPRWLISHRVAIEVRATLREPR
jgi:polyisoprenoid-binding protein YceI